MWYDCETRSFCRAMHHTHTQTLLVQIVLVPLFAFMFVFVSVSVCVWTIGVPLPVSYHSLSLWWSDVTVMPAWLKSEPPCCPYQPEDRGMGRKKTREQQSDWDMEERVLGQERRGIVLHLRLCRLALFSCLPVLSYFSSQVTRVTTEDEWRRIIPKLIDNQLTPSDCLSARSLCPALLSYWSKSFNLVYST